MDCCICIQCYCKPIETLYVLKSLEKCEEIKNIHLLLFIDKASNNSKFEINNLNLIALLQNYKEEKSVLYKSITIYIPENNLGPYIGCYTCIEYAFKISPFIIFSEDDALFCKDSLKYYFEYMNGNILDEDNCLGITGYSNYFYFNSNKSFNIVNDNIEINNINLINKINIVKNNIIDNNLLNKIIKINWAPNKQFGLFKNKWDKIKYFRTNEYLNIKTNLVPDYATGLFTKENNFYFYYSVIPRTNDIGLMHELGCTTLYYNGKLNFSTIKFLTSDDFNIINNNYDIIDNININIMID